MKIVTVENKSEWNDLLLRCKHVSILQTWEYGEAKQNVEGVIPIRNIITDGVKPIGIVQTLVRKIPLFRGIARINRGPLILPEYHRSHLDPFLQILKLLHDHWVKWERMVLLIAPNIQKNEIDCVKLQELGYDATNNNAWESILVDLSLDEVALRKNLHQKWRNLLNKAEKINLELEIANSVEGLSFLMSRYNQMMTEKNFSGPSEKLIKEIKNVTLDESSVQVMFAVKNSVRIGGVLVLGYIDTCHYLVGWNSTEGKIFQSNYFLLWQAMLIFKKMGYRWFDLGGINEKLTPGITHFKRGLGGNEYVLIGEFEAFPSGFFYSLAKKFIKLGLKHNRR
ncbi:MAG: hypothetical protein A2106_05265 [Planctomycetes bacterium GWF2_40_8]|nr:MAG: hypothetical protein A2106_05265 [Planctomycetes bacterium GWF2_40_8]